MAHSHVVWLLPKTLTLQQVDVEYVGYKEQFPGKGQHVRCDRRCFGANATVLLPLQGMVVTMCSSGSTEICDRKPQKSQL